MPGSAPVLTAASSSGDTTPNLVAAISGSIRYIDKHGKAIDPKSIKPTERLQPLYDSGPGGLVLVKVMVDRN